MANLGESNHVSPRSGYCCGLCVLGLVEACGSSKAVGWRRLLTSDRLLTNCDSVIVLACARSAFRKLFALMFVADEALLRRFTRRGAEAKGWIGLEGALRLVATRRKRPDRHGNAAERWGPRKSVACRHHGEQIGAQRVGGGVSPISRAGVVHEGRAWCCSRNTKEL